MAKKDEQQLRQPDQFQRTSMQLWDVVAANSQQIAIGLGVMVLALVVYAGFTAHQRGARDEAGAALAKALVVAARPVSKEEPAAGESPPEPDEAPFKTDAEKQGALVTALLEVRNRFADSEAGVAALLPLGDAQFKLGKLDEAKASYESYLAKGAKDDAFHALAQLGLARVAESKKDFAGASGSYETLQREAPHAFLKDVAALGKARMLEAQGKKAEAAEAFQTIKDGYPNTESSREAAEHLSALAAQGVHPAPRLPLSNPDGGAALTIPVNKE